MTEWNVTGGSGEASNSTDGNYAHLLTRVDMRRDAPAVDGASTPGATSTVAGGLAGTRNQGDNAIRFFTG